MEHIKMEINYKFCFQYRVKRENEWYKLWNEYQFELKERRRNRRDINIIYESKIRRYMIAHNLNPNDWHKRDFISPPGGRDLKEPEEVLKFINDFP